MNSQPQSVAQANHACAARANTALFANPCIALLICCMAFWSLSLRAQSFAQYDLSDFVHAVNGPNILLSQGDTATFEVTLGGKDAPANDVMGMRLDLVLSSLAQVSDPVAISVDGSWCFDAGNLYTQTTADATSLSLLVQAADSNSMSGAGIVFSFQLIAAQDDVEPSDMIVAIDGIVIIENIDFKMAQYPRGNALAVGDPDGEAATSLSDAPMGPKPCFPNPTQGRLQLPWILEPGMQLQLIGTDGQVHVLDAQYYSAATLLDISNFPAGAYQLLVLCAGQTIYRDRILKI